MFSEFLLKPDPKIALFVTTSTLTIFLIFFFNFKSKNHKALYSGFIFFFYIYNGFGISYIKGVYHDLINYYIIFLFAFSFFYLLFLKILKKEFHLVSKISNSFLIKFQNNKYNIFGVIVFFFILKLILLVYPEMKLQNLLNPQTPDIVGEFLRRYEVPVNSFTKVLNNIIYLIYPFYLVSLVKYYKKPIILSFLIFFPGYIEYSVDSYIGRSEMLSLMFLFISILWYFNKKIKKYILIFSVIAIPLLPIYLLKYAEIRNKNNDDRTEYKTNNAIKIITFSETSFPIYSEKVIKSNITMDLKQYFYWLVTLPIPKIILNIGRIPSAGMEMSEIILEKKQGDEGFYALLAGLLTESVYIYGRTYFWLHAIFIALIFAFVSKFTENNKFLFPIFIVISIYLCYNLNRAGIASAFPPIINLFFSLYLIIFLMYIHKKFKIKAFNNESL